MTLRRFFPLGSMKRRSSPVDFSTLLTCFRNQIFVCWSLRLQQMQFLEHFWQGVLSKIRKGMWDIPRTLFSSWVPAKLSIRQQVKIYFTWLKNRIVFKSAEVGMARLFVSNKIWIPGKRTDLKHTKINHFMVVKVQNLR